MSDSVDRVFSHALNTVNKIRTGSQKPPSATRLKLYGLYKQAMEGDVDGIMERPQGNSEEAHRAREKWDAWKQQNSLSRTEAKRRYITTLISTMHKYASPSPDSRELVAELEFVWDQVKSNVPSSASSSPQQHSQTLGAVGMHMPPAYQNSFATGSPSKKARHKTQAIGLGNDADLDADGPLQVKSPMSQSEEELEEHVEALEEYEEEDEEADPEEEFVDAPDSLVSDAAVQTSPQKQTHLRPRPPVPYTPSKPPPPGRSFISRLTPSLPVPVSSGPPPSSAADAKWRSLVSAALAKQTAELAALREQLEARRLFSHSRKFLVLRFVWRLLWGAAKHVAIDVLVLGLVLLWMRRRDDRRLEGAVRVLLGDAVAQVQKVGKVKLPGVGVGLGKKG